MAGDHRKALSYLNEVHAFLSKDDETTKKNRTTLNDLLLTLIKHLKERDPLFSKAFKRIGYTGSYYDGLRIREADEFDVNFLISLPVEKNEFELDSEVPGFVSYTLTESGRNSLRDREDGPVLQRLEELFDKELRLLAQHFRTWFQSITDRALQSYKSSNDYCNSFTVRPSQSGPAKTLYVLLDDGKQIDIDLVPVMEFSYDLLPKAFPRYEWIDKYCGEIDKRWLMVPKNPKDKENSGMVQAWRVHFPDIEKELIKDFGCLKPVIRLVKAVRDAYNWPVSSYAIKTVVMRHRLSKPNKSHWENEWQWTLLLEVLERLHKELLSDSGICYLFDERMDLIHDLKQVTRVNIAGCLRKQVLNKLSQSPENILVVLKIQPPTQRRTSSPLFPPLCKTPEVVKVQQATPSLLTSSPLVPGCKTPNASTSSSSFSGDATPDEVYICRQVEGSRNIARSLFRGVTQVSSDSELESSHAGEEAVAANASLLDEAFLSFSDCASEAFLADEREVKSGESQIDKASRKSSNFADSARKVPFGESRIGEVTQSSSDSMLEGSFADELATMSRESGFNEVSQSSSEIASVSYCVDEAKIIIGQQLKFPVSNNSGDNVGSTVPDIEVTLSIAASDGRMLAEATCSMGSVRKLELEIPKSELPSRAEAASLVVKQRFKSSGESPSFDALVSLKTSAGRQLAQANFTMQVGCGTHKCQLCVPMPVLE